MSFFVLDGRRWLAVVLLLLLPVAALGVNARELRALMEMKAALDPGGRILASWTTAGGPCSGGAFDGVACNEHGEVTTVSLQGRGLAGALSPSVAALKRLSGLYLHYNSLTGGIPAELGNLTELTELYLNVNSLSGRVPPELARMSSLRVLQLGYNQLEGGIPSELGRLTRLTVVAVQSNGLAGAIPASLGDLSELRRLDLSFNRLFGSIPATLAKLPQLATFDVRNNSLSGDVPAGLSRLNDGFQYGNNSGLCGARFRGLRACSTADDQLEPLGVELPPIANVSQPRGGDSDRRCTGGRCSGPLTSSVIAAAIVAGVCLAAGLAAGFLALAWRRRSSKIGREPTPASVDADGEAAKESCRKSTCSLISLDYPGGWDPLADESGGAAISPRHRLNPAELEFATQCFAEANLIGRRGGGLAATYRGTLRDGTAVAVTRLSLARCRQEGGEFVRALKQLTELRHENVASLRGFCCSRGRGECLLVYELASNGSLAEYLAADYKNPRSVLDWPTRVGIIKGVARGIEYIHGRSAHKAPLLHQHISAETILLNGVFRPLITGAGVHKLLTDDAIFSSLKLSATMGYLAPEYATIGRMTEKSDVYAFGILMVQVLTGKSETDSLLIGLRRGGEARDLVDRNLAGNYSVPVAAKLADVALACTSEVPEQRPSMEAVIIELNDF